MKTSKQAPGASSFGGSAGIQWLVFVFVCIAAWNVRGADPAEVVRGQSCAIHLTSEIDLAIADDGGLCSFRPSGEAKPLRFKIVPGLADTNLVSFESVEHPGLYLRHFLFRLRLEQKPERPDRAFNGDATFEVRPARKGEGVRLRSFNYRDFFVAATYTRKAYLVPDPSPDSMVLTLVY